MALTSAHERATGASLSAEYLHWACGLHPGGRGSPHAAGLALRMQGQPPHAQWPYDQHTDETLPGYGPDSAVTGPFARTRGDRVLAGVDDVIEELRRGRWAIVGLRVTDAFAAPGTGIVLPDGPGRAGHAVLTVGALVVRGDDLKPHLSDGDRLLCVRNSWGAGWGLDGHKLISEAALTECAILSLALDDDVAS